MEFIFGRKCFDFALKSKTNRWKNPLKRQMHLGVDFWKATTATDVYKMPHICNDGLVGLDMCCSFKFIESEVYLLLISR